MGIVESAVLNALTVVTDPDLGRDIVSLGFVKNLTINGGRVTFSIELTTPACPVKDQMRDQAQAAVAALAGVTDVDVQMTASVRPAVTPTLDVRRFPASRTSSRSVRVRAGLARPRWR